MQMREGMRGDSRRRRTAAMIARLAGLCLGVGVAAGAMGQLTEDNRGDVYRTAMRAILEDPSGEGVGEGLPARASRYPPFSFDSCGDETEPALRLSKLEVRPDPITLPGPLNVTLGAWALKRPLDSPLRVAITMEKDVFGLWKSVPCIEGFFGSCEFDDLCASLATLPCPSWAVALGIPCSCPLQPGGWPQVAVDLEISSTLPVPELAGGYRIRVEVGAQGQAVGCYETTFTVLNQLQELEA